jgi:hypothetical protein
MTVQDTLAERQKTHGSFPEQATTAQLLKAVMRDTPNWNDLPPYYRESLEMIQSKISRALHGDWTHIDNPHDGGGYFGLVERELEKSAPVGLKACALSD